MLTTTESPAPRPKSRPKPSQPVRKAGDRVKTTIVLDRQADIRLSVLAAMRGLVGSALVAEILAPHLRGVVVSLRGQAGEAGDALPIGEPMPAA